MIKVSQKVWIAIISLTSIFIYFCNFYSLLAVTGGISGWKEMNVDPREYGNSLLYAYFLIF